MKSIIPRITRTIQRQARYISRMHFSSYLNESSEAEMMKDYHAWRAMGEGGTSLTWPGYLSTVSAEKTMAFKDTIGLDIYSKLEKYATGWKQASAAQREAACKSFLKEPLPQREGERSRAKRYVFPQREKNADEYIDPAIRKAYNKSFKALGEANPATEWKTSALEKHGTALFLSPSAFLTPLASPTKREICHIHTSDMSGHVTLSFVDAQEVIAKGWGERHRLSGTDWIQLGYTMVYVPRTVEETEVLSKIFQAGVDFMMSG